MTDTVSINIAHLQTNMQQMENHVTMTTWF